VSPLSHFLFATRIFCHLYGFDNCPIFSPASPITSAEHDQEEAGTQRTLVSKDEAEASKKQAEVQKYRDDVDRFAWSAPNPARVGEEGCGQRHQSAVTKRARFLSPAQVGGLIGQM